MSKYLNVAPDEPMGSEGDTEEALREWLIGNTDDLPVEERIRQAEIAGVYDIADQLRNQKA